MSDDFGQQLLKLMMVRALEGESNIDEHIQWNVATKALMQLAQAGTVAAGILVALSGIAAIALSIAHAADHGFTNVHAVAIVLGLSLLPAGILLTYRQVKELLDPFGKMSPVERMIEPYLDQVFGIQPEDTQEPARLVPYRVNHRTQAITAEPALHDSGIHPDDLDFVAFIREAARRGLSRDSLVTQPRIRLRPTGTLLTRPVYDAMIKYAADRWRIIEAGGDGFPARWRIEPDEVLEMLEEELSRIREAQ